MAVLRVWIFAMLVCLLCPHFNYFSEMKVTANIATYPPRITPQCLGRAINSLINQVDLIRIYFNECRPDLSLFVKYPDAPEKILILGNYNRTDNGKFYSLENITEPEIYLTCDDDLIYPPDYVKRMVEAIEHYKCIVSFHGRQLLGAGLDYYKEHKSFHCLHGVIHDEMVDVVGTGVTGFDTRYFHPKGLANSPDQKMSDLIFSLEAAKQNKQMGVISHAPNWIKHIDNKETIHSTESVKGTPRQNQIANEIFELKYG